jgi:hypothetical protein
MVEPPFARVSSVEDAIKDQRLLRLYRYWLERRGDRAFPARRDVDPADFAYALGRVSLIEVLREPLSFRYRIVATRLTSHLGYEMSGKPIDAIPSSDHRAFVRGFYEHAVAQAAPLYDTGNVRLDDRVWWHETLALPLAADGGTIDMLMVYRNTRPPTDATPDNRAV